MKRLMLLMSAALLALSSCSKGADEPQLRDQNEEEQVTIRLHIEGTRDDVTVVDQEAHALNLTGTTRGNKITKVTLGNATEVDGII